jgi:hypothetical protein
MADNNTINVFGKTLVDLTGLNAFCTAAKNYIDGAVENAVDVDAVSGMISTAIDEALVDVNDSITAVDTKIGTSIANLDPTTKGADGQYASNVKVENGKIVVTYTDLPEETDWTGAIATAKGEAITAASEALDAHANATVNGETGKIHIQQGERDKWNLAANRIDTFLTSTETKDAIDNLTEINNWFATHGGNYDTLLGVVNGHTTSIGNNADAIALINTNLATISIATAEACAALVIAANA